MRFNFAFGALFPALLGGCAAAGVMATSDPRQKLVDAAQLLRMNRALPADRLIREAIDRYREQQDFTGLGWAQKFYGDFVRSAAFAEWPQFRDLYPDTATPERRRALAELNCPAGAPSE